MNELVGKISRLEECRRRRCNRLFYVESGDREGLELDFGCPFGCDEPDISYECICDAMVRPGGDGR